MAQLHIGTTSGPQPRSCLPRHRSWSPSHLYGYQHHQQQQSDIPTQQSTTLSQQLSFSLIVKKILCGYGLVLNLSKIKLKLSEFTAHTPSTQSFYIYLHFHDKNAEYVRFITRYVLYISRRSRKTLLITDSKVLICDNPRARAASVWEGRNAQCAHMLVPSPPCPCPCTLPPPALELQTRLREV